MLRKLDIAGFKSIRSQVLELGRVTVLIGQNGAGKSNVLEAVGMLSAAAAGTVTYESLASRGVRLSTPGVYRSALKGGHRPKYFDLAAVFDNLRYHCNIYTSDLDGVGAWSFHSESVETNRKNNKWKRIAGRSAKGIKIGSQSIEKTRIKGSESIVSAVELLAGLNDKEQKSLDDLKMFAIYAPTTGVLRGVDTDSRIKSPLGLTGGGLPVALRQAITKTKNREFVRFFKILSWFRSISIGPPSPNLKSPLLGGGSEVLTFADQFMTNDFNKLYSYDVSEGALYVAFVLTLMLHPETPKFFALDNVDSTLNPGLVRNLMVHIGELAKTYDKQVILTTHNPSALDALDLFDDDVRLYVVDRGASGETELTRLSPPADMTREGWAAQFAGAKLSELWMDGLLGGITPAEEM